MVKLDLDFGEFKEFVVKVKKMTTPNLFLGDCPGIHYLIRFKNDYGASIIKRYGSYGYEDDLWELAVIDWDGDDFGLNYDTPITDDVCGYLTEEDLFETLEQIKNL